MQAKRGHRGIITLLLILAKPLEDMWVRDLLKFLKYHLLLNQDFISKMTKDHIQVFSRTSTGRYQPWVFDLDLDGTGFNEKIV